MVPFSQELANCSKNKTTVLKGQNNKTYESRWKKEMIRLRDQKYQVKEEETKRRKN
jgi:hypothetical protein